MPPSARVILRRNHSGARRDPTGGSTRRDVGLAHSKRKKRGGAWPRFPRGHAVRTLPEDVQLDVAAWEISAVRFVRRAVGSTVVREVDGCSIQGDFDLEPIVAARLPVVADPGLVVVAGGPVDGRITLEVPTLVLLVAHHIVVRDVGPFHMADRA